MRNVGDPGTHPPTARQTDARPPAASRNRVRYHTGQTYDEVNSKCVRFGSNVRPRFTSGLAVSVSARARRDGAQLSRTGTSRLRRCFVAIAGIVGSSRCRWAAGPRSRRPRAVSRPDAPLRPHASQPRASSPIVLARRALHKPARRPTRRRPLARTLQRAPPLPWQDDASFRRLASCGNARFDALEHACGQRRGAVHPL